MSSQDNKEPITAKNENKDSDKKIKRQENLRELRGIFIIILYFNELIC